MNSNTGPGVLPEVAAAAIELERRGLASSEMGWSAIALGVVRETEDVHSELRHVFKSKWGELHISFVPEDLAASLRVRLAGAVLRAKASRVTCQVCGRAARGGAEWDVEIVGVLCAEHRAAADSGISH